MKQYLLFAGDTYYPAGGWDDLIGSYDTVNEAVVAAKALQHNDWWHVVDKNLGEEVASHEGTK